MTMAWVFPDEADEATDALRESLISERVSVPALWPIEVAHVLLVATRRGRIIEDDWPRIRQNLAVLPIEVDQMPPESILEKVLPIANEYQTSVYDAMYLELSLRLGLPIATLDRKLADAGKKAGLEILAGSTG